MTKKFKLTIEMSDDNVLSVDWDQQNMSYTEMLGFLEVAKDHIKDSQDDETETVEEDGWECEDCGRELDPSKDKVCPQCGEEVFYGEEEADTEDDDSISDGEF